MSYQHANKYSLKWRTRVVWHDITHINWSRHTDECFICNTCYIYASRCVMSRSSCSVGCIHTPRRVKLNESFVWETRLIQIRLLKLQDSLIICICRCIDICRCFDSFVCRCTCIWYMCVYWYTYCMYIRQCAYMYTYVYMYICTYRHGCMSSTSLANSATGEYSERPAPWPTSSSRTMCSGCGR